MSTTQQHGSIPSTAVEFAPGLWRTSLQRYDLSVPGREMIQSRVDVEPGSAPIRHFHPGEEIIYVLAGSLEYTPPPVTAQPYPRRPPPPPQPGQTVTDRSQGVQSPAIQNLVTYWAPATTGAGPNRGGRHGR